MPTEGAARKARGVLKTHGGNATRDRLAEYLETARSTTEIFVIDRSVEGPIDTMSDLWTDLAHFAQWLPPTGFTMEFRRVDIGTGGDAFYAMANGAFTMYGRLEYLRVERPAHLQYTQCFAPHSWLRGRE